MSAFRLILVLFCLLSVFYKILSKITDLSIFKYLDEIIFFSVILFLITYYITSKKVHIINLILLVFISYSVIVSLLFGFNKNFIDVVLQTLISVKFFILITGFILIFKNNFKYLDWYFKIVFGIAFLSFFIHVIFGVQFNNFFSISAFARPNIRYSGFIAHPNHMAYLAVLFIGYTLSKVKSTNSIIDLKNLLKIIICITIIFLTDSRTSILAAAIFFLAFYWDLLLKNAMVLLYVFSTLLLSIVLLTVFTDVFDSIILNISQTFTLESTYIRGNMIYLSGLIFYQFFPIGTGAASFGSVMANNKVYEYYDQADRYYFANDIGLYDSNIASITGEYGFVGLILYFLLFFCTYKYLVKTFKTKGVMLKSVFFLFLFYTITNPMITNNVYILITLPILLKIASINNTNSEITSNK